MPRYLILRQNKFYRENKKKKKGKGAYLASSPTEAPPAHLARPSPPPFVFFSNQLGVELGEHADATATPTTF
jgi:hypothetical protein